MPPRKKTTTKSAATKKKTAKSEAPKRRGRPPKNDKVIKVSDTSTMEIRKADAPAQDLIPPDKQLQLVQDNLRVLRELLDNNHLSLHLKTALEERVVGQLSVMDAITSSIFQVAVGVKVSVEAKEEPKAPRIDASNFPTPASPAATAPLPPTDARGTVVPNSPPLPSAPFTGAPPIASR